MEDWHHIPILLTLERVEVGANANNIIAILLKCMVNIEEFLMRSLVQGGCDLVMMKVLCSKDITLL
jgi:hypothetical protein